MERSMELQDALRQIDAIRAQVARTEVFRGYKAWAVAASGAIGFAAAACQSSWAPDPAADVGRYLQLWIAAAAACVAIVGSEPAVRWLATDSPLLRQQTLRAVEQFVPCVAAGAALTWAIARFAPQSAELLPGLWAIVFSLGIFASWRQLPAASLGVAVFYLVAGVVCLAVARGPHAFSPWAMAGTFGIGQWLTAGVLHFALERDHAA
jgi:hypothetical protein